MFNIFISFYSGIYVAKRLTRQVMNTSIASAVINVALNFGLIWLIGIWAAAVSTAVAYGALAVNRYYDMKKYMNIRYDRGLTLKIFGAFLMVVAVYYVPYFIPELYWINLANFALAFCVALVFNRTLLVKLRRYAMGRLRVG